MYSFPFVDNFYQLLHIFSNCELFYGLIFELMTYFSAGSTTLVMVRGPADAIASWACFLVVLLSILISLMEPFNQIRLSYKKARPATDLVSTLLYPVHDEKRTILEYSAFS